MDLTHIHKIYTHKYTFEQIKDLYNEERKNKRGKKVKSLILPNGNKYRLTDTFRIFMEKGNTCRSCGKPGTYFLQIPKRANKFESLCNIYLFTEDEKLMTGDHIIPRSVGGSDRMLNMQPMCNTCNWVKDNKIPEIEMEFLYSYRQILELVLSKHPRNTPIGDKFYEEYKTNMKYRCMKKLPSFMNLDEIEICLYIINDEYNTDIKIEDLRVKLAPKIPIL